MYHVFFIHSSADGHLGCFPVLATVNRSAVNSELHISFGIRVFIFFPDIHPGVGSLDHMVVLFLVF